VTTEFWRMGATPVPITGIADFARAFEAAGWDGVAVGEAHGLLPDPYVALGIAATATTTALEPGARGEIEEKAQWPVEMRGANEVVQAMFEKYALDLQQPREHAQLH